MSDDLREAGSASATPDAARDDAAPSTGSVPAGTSSPAAERAAPEGGDDANEPEPGAEESTNGAPEPPARRRRRRGSRGGRNRRKPAVTAVGDDYHDARADRGLTTEDLAADALEHAGLRRPPAGAVAHAGD